MGLFGRLKETLANATGGLSPEALASLTPEQRAAYDAKMSDVQAVQQQAASAKADSDAQHAASVARRPLYGPAGEWVFGSSTPGGLTPEQIATKTPAEMLASTRAQSTSQVKDLLTNSLGRTSPPAAPGPSDGPLLDRRQHGVERAARDAARQPYNAEHPSPVVFTRLATRGKTQIEEVAAYLASSGLAARPDLVYGLYRVPDRISPALGGSEAGRVVEWDIVHGAQSALAPTNVPVVATFIDGQDRMVRRHVGEPSVLDEDLGVVALASQGIGPEQTLGIARHLVIRSYSHGEDGSSGPISHVTGMHVFRPGSGGADALAEIPRPIDVPFDGPGGVRVVALNWGAVARAVQPQPQRAPIIPSPFPYLPSTAQELIRMYIEIVGLRPNDCYATAVTEDGPHELGRQTWLAGGLVEWETFGDLQPCADGKERRRMAGGWLVLITHRDLPEYEAGRARWAAYQAEVLQAALEHGTELRRPVDPPVLAGIPKGLRRIVRGTEKVIDVFAADSPNDVLAELPPHRYCSPAIE
jgi:hypothetical protein